MKKFIRPIKAFLILNRVFAFLAGILMLTISNESFSQCQPYIMIDGNRVLANQTAAAGLYLPYWLKENQTLAIDQMVNSISVIEFTVANGNSLEFSQVLKISSTSPQTVPSGKVWKIESISKQATLSDVYGAAYQSAGTYTFTVPACASYICIEAWGGGGGGGGGHGSSSYGGGGGGGGGYGQQCFTVTPGASYTVTVGAGGSAGAVNSSGSTGGTSSVGSLISVTGGNGGSVGGASAGGTGGTGGTSAAPVHVDGGSGSSGAWGGNTRNGGAGGSSGSGPALNGGAGAAGVLSGQTGLNGFTPGGAGSGGAYACAGGTGAPGRVIITW